MNRPYINLIDNKRETIFFLFVGILVSISFYYFFIYLFEVERSLSQLLSFNRSASVSKIVRLKANFVFGGISALMGNAVFLSLRFQKTRIERRVKRIGSRILNDVGFVLPGFIHWFTRITFTVWVAITGSIYEVYIQSAFPYFILAFYVLYLDSMKTINRFLGKKRFLTLLVHSTSLLLLALILSFSSVNNFNKTHNHLNEIRPVVSVPTIDCKTCLLNPDYNSPIAIKIHHKNNLTTFSLEGEECDQDKIIQQLNGARNTIRDDNIIYPALWVESATPISEVIEFEKYLFLNHEPKIKYAFKIDLKEVYWEEINYVQKHIPITEDLINAMPDYDFPPFPTSILEEENTFYTTLNRVDIYLSNSKLNEASVDSISKTLLAQMQKNTVFNFNFEGNLTFQNYLKGLVAFQNSRELFLKKERGLSKPLNSVYSQKVSESNKLYLDALSELNIRLVENYEFQEK